MRLLTHLALLSSFAFCLPAQEPFSFRDVDGVTRIAVWVSMALSSGVVGRYCYACASKGKIQIISLRAIPEGNEGWSSWGQNSENINNCSMFRRLWR